MHANLGYQPQVSTKFQLNQTAHGWEILIFVRPNKQTNKQTDMNLGGQVKPYKTNKNTVFGVVAVSESFVNRICVIRKIVTSSTHVDFNIYRHHHYLHHSCIRDM